MALIVRPLKLFLFTRIQIRTWFSISLNRKEIHCLNVLTINLIRKCSNILKTLKFLTFSKNIICSYHYRIFVTYNWVFTGNPQKVRIGRKNNPPYSKTNPTIWGLKVLTKFAYICSNLLSIHMMTFFKNRTLLRNMDFCSPL